MYARAVERVTVNPLSRKADADCRVCVRACRDATGSPLRTTDINQRLSKRSGSGIYRHKSHDAAVHCRTCRIVNVPAFRCVRTFARPAHARTTRFDVLQEARSRLSDDSIKHDLSRCRGAWLPLARKWSSYVAPRLRMQQ